MDRRNPGGIRALIAFRATILFLALWSGAAASVEEPEVSPSESVHLNARNTIGDILRHPAFAGFGHSLLPWDDRRYDEDLRIDRLDELLPYHSHVDPETVVSALNRMIDDDAEGRTIYYPIDDDESQGSRAGLFFFRGRPGTPFAIIAPGGGFSYVASVHEGFPYAAEISREGYNAFVLKYRAGRGGEVATRDLAAAISLVLRRADALGVDPNGYSLWGSSAGARMAAAIGSHGVARYGAEGHPKPAVVVMAYTALSDFSADEPPTFVVAGEHDGIAPPATMKRRVEALRRSGVAVKYHEYPGLGHGFGLGTGTSAEGWVSEALRFWEGFLPR